MHFIFLPAFLKKREIEFLRLCFEKENTEQERKRKEERNIYKYLIIVLEEPAKGFF